MAIALGRQALPACSSADSDGDGRVRINDLVAAVDRALNGCEFTPLRFRPPALFAAGSSHRGVTVDDFNGDGVIDIVLADVGAPSLPLLLGVGDGSFEAPRMADAGGTSFAVASGDFDGDGRLDVVTVNDFGTNDASVLLGNDTDARLGLSIRLPTGAAPVGVAVGHINSDGLLDFVAANNGSADVSLFLGRGDGTFGDERRIPVGPRPRGVTIADFNADGHADIATANITSNDISIALGAGDGTFASEPTARGWPRSPRRGRG